DPALLRELPGLRDKAALALTRLPQRGCPPAGGRVPQHPPSPRAAERPRRLLPAAIMTGEASPPWRRDASQDAPRGDRRPGLPRAPARPRDRLLLRERRDGLRLDHRRLRQAPGGGADDTAPPARAPRVRGSVDGPRL